MEDSLNLLSYVIPRPHGHYPLTTARRAYEWSFVNPTRREQKSKIACLGGTPPGGGRKKVKSSAVQPGHVQYCSNSIRRRASTSDLVRTKALRKLSSSPVLFISTSDYLTQGDLLSLRVPLSKAIRTSYFVSYSHVNDQSCYLDIAFSPNDIQPLPSDRIEPGSFSGRKHQHVVMDVLKKVGCWFAPPPNKAEDGRDAWPSRASFLLASMGGCAGMGNLLRYPSQVYNNHGLQWYIPYLMAVFIVAIPVLVLEIAIGQAYRGGSVVAYANVNQRLKGLGLSLIYVGFVVTPYFVVNLAWIMSYFRHSFTSPLPWTNEPDYFFNRKVVANVDPIEGNLTADGTSVLNYTEYPGTALLGETTGWAAFTFFLMYISIFRGVGLTGRVVYFTMGLPIVVTIVLIGRSVSLENAGEGVKLYFATWRGEQLARGQVWQTACGQVRTPFFNHSILYFDPLLGMLSGDVFDER